MHLLSGGVRSVLRCTVPDCTVPSAALDGRWLELEADIKGAAFDWRWIELRHVGEEAISSIQGRTLTFPNGSNHDLEHRADGVVSVTVKSKTYEALFVHEEQKLIWSHGFVWIREGAQREAQERELGCSEGAAKNSQEHALSTNHGTAEAKAPQCEMPNAEPGDEGSAQSQAEQRLDPLELGSEDAPRVPSQTETASAVALASVPSQNGHTAASTTEFEVPPAVKHWSAKQAQFSDSPPPPDGWIYGMSRSTGKHYYIDIQTGRTTYTTP